ncbi:MAG: hypothetical protein ACR2IE_13305 [Candidatus Sumerlaeaceae bacterium]
MAFAPPAVAEPGIIPPDAQTSGIIRVWPELLEAVQSNTDLWGEQAITQPDGPSYEFFKSKMPTFHYVDTDFRHYPIVLSGPGSPRKARLVSNGSGVNSRANAKYWKEIGFPVTFRVGDSATTYGEDLHRLDGPRYRNGYLPVVEMAYLDGSAEYALEAFTPVDKKIVDNAPVLLQFGLRKGESALFAADIDATRPLTEIRGTLRDSKGALLVAFDSSWKWDAEAQRLNATLSSKTSATLAIFTEPLSGAIPFQIEPASYAKLRRQCCDYWDGLLNRGTRIETPEAVVNNSWRAHIVANYMLLNGNRMHYSAGNQYEKLYEAEGGDAVRGLMLFGHLADMPRMIIPLLDFTRPGLIYHQAGLKLQLLTRYYWLTRDAAFVHAQRRRWQPEVDKILNDRQTSTGLLPREQYAGDIATKVYSLNSNANSWRGLREMATVLGAMGDDVDARRYTNDAAKFRDVIVDAATSSIDRSTSVPFVPLALFGEIPIDGRLSATRLGGYYDLMLPYIIGSRIFGPGSDPETWMIETLKQRGGLCMGMIRGAGLNKMYGGVTGGFNNLYTIRLTVAQLERDEVDRALVSFYGKLAQGQTWDTFISGEGSGMAPYDEHGRPFYDPPNSAANAYLLHMLRYMLVQDWDLDDDCTPETLRLMFATPGRWLAAGGKIGVERAPTAFGEVSVSAESHLDKGEVIMKVSAPSRNMPATTLLRCRLPAGHQVISATANGKALSVDAKGSADVSKLRGTYTVKFTCTR